MEESFREEIKRYIRRPGGQKITPRQIPPLIAISGSMPPTSRNKMFNAIIDRKNFGGQWTMPTVTASKKKSMESNILSLKKLLASSSRIGRILLGGRLKDEKPVGAESLVFESSNSELIQFLKNKIATTKTTPRP